MTLNSVGQLEFRPDRDEYSDRTFYWMLTVHERGNEDLFTKSMQMQVSVLPPVHLEYEVIITDGATGSGQIIFSLAVHMAWLKDNFDSFFSATLVEWSTGASTNVDSLKAISFENIYAGRVVNFEVDSFDVRTFKLQLDVVMGAADYGKEGALFVIPNAKLDNLNYVADVPATRLSYTVKMLDMDLGTGQIKFSHAINMAWLEENFPQFFNIYLLGNDDGLNYALGDLEMTFDSEDDGRVVDFTVPAFEADDRTLTVDIAMDQEDYSRADALFVLSSSFSSFEFNNVVFAATVPGEDSGSGSILIGTGVREGVTVDDGDDDDDDVDVIITWSIVGGFLLLVAIAVCCYCCICPWCRKRRVKKQEEDQRIMLGATV